MAEQEYVAARSFRAGGEDYVGDFERGETVPLEKLYDPHILKETGDVVLANSDEGRAAIADYEKHHGSQANAGRERVLRFAEELRSSEPTITGQESHEDGGAREDDPVALSVPDGAGRDELLAAGYDTDEKVRAASDEDLLSVDGIGEKKLEKIREHLAPA